MKVGVIGAGTMGQGIAKAFAQVEGYTVALCDIKQEWADNGKEALTIVKQFWPGLILSDIIRPAVMAAMRRSTSAWSSLPLATSLA